MFSSLLLWMSGSEFRKGVCWEGHFRLEEPHLWTLAVQQMVYEGPGLPSSSTPLLHLNMLSGKPSPYPWDNLLRDGICKTDDVAHCLIGSTKITEGFWVFCVRPNLLIQLGICVLSHFIALHSSGMGRKVWMPFSFHEGNKCTEV